MSCHASPAFCLDRLLLPVAVITPVVPVTGKGSGRVSIARFTSYRPRQRSQLIYGAIVHCGPAVDLGLVRGVGVAKGPS